MLLLFLAFAFLPAVIGSRTGPDAWFDALDKPAWNPPSWLFAPVWIVLYLLMGIAAWVVWRRGGGAVTLILWGLQLALNAGWSPLFFGLHRPDLAVVDIALLWVVLAATVIAFWRVSSLSGALLVPYLVWLTFASALNVVIWRLNA